MQPVAGLIQVCRRRRDGQIRQHASDAPNMGWVHPAAVTALEQASQSRVRYPHWPIIACNTSRCKRNSPISRFIVLLFRCTQFETRELDRSDSRSYVGLQQQRGESLAGLFRVPSPNSRRTGQPGFRSWFEGPNPGCFSCRWGPLIFCRRDKGGGTARSGQSMRHFHIARSYLFSVGLAGLFGLPPCRSTKNGEDDSDPPQKGGSYRPR